MNKTEINKESLIEYAKYGIKLCDMLHGQCSDILPDAPMQHRYSKPPSLHLQRAKKK